MSDTMHSPAPIPGKTAGETIVQLRAMLHELLKGVVTEDLDTCEHCLLVNPEKLEGPMREYVRAVIDALRERAEMEKQV